MSETFNIYCDVSCHLAKKSADLFVEQTDHFLAGSSRNRTAGLCPKQAFLKSALIV